MSHEDTMNVTAGGGSGTHWGGGKGKGTSGSGGRGNKGGESSQLQQIGASLAAVAGIEAYEFSFYFIENGHVLGVSKTATVGVDDNVTAAVVDLGPVPPTLINSTSNMANKNDVNEQYSLTSVYKGNFSDARIAELKSTIAKYIKWANCKQSGRRITEARLTVRDAKTEIAIINLVRQKQAEEKSNDEKDALNKASALLSDLGEKVSAHMGERFRATANEIANDIKKFQAKNIRSFNDAMNSLSKITTNPGMKVNKADKAAIINAWQHVNASDMANKLGNLSKAFKVADIVQKVEKVREKSIAGYETGDWGPLMLEVESWIVSGFTASWVLGVVAAIIGLVSLSPLALTALTIAGIIGISILASMIDDKVVDKINKEIIRPAY